MLVASDPIARLSQPVTHPSCSMRCVGSRNIDGRVHQPRRGCNDTVGRLMPSKASGHGKVPACSGMQRSNRDGGSILSNVGMQGTRLLSQQRRQIRKPWQPAAVTAVATVGHDAEEHRPLARLQAGASTF